jgi:hypothetical protein
MSRIDLAAQGDAGKDWEVAAGLPGMGGDGANAALRLVGDGEVDGSLVQHVASGDTAEWSVAPKDPSVIAHVKRSDNGACWKVALGMQPFVLKDGDLRIGGDPSAGELAARKVFKALTITVEPDPSSPEQWRVSGSARVEVDRKMGVNAQTFYGPIQVRVKGTLDPVTGEMKADCTLTQRVRYDRMTGYDNTPRKGSWTNRFVGRIEPKIDQNAEEILIDIPGQNAGKYRSQRDNREWDSGDTDGPWTYHVKFKREPL